MKKIEENFHQTRLEILRLVLDHAPRGVTPRSVAQNRRYVEEIEGGNERTDQDSFYFQFERAGTEITLYVEVEASSWDKKLDNDGNEYLQRAVTCRLNWPIDGSRSPSVALARFAFYTEVANFANEIEASYKDHTVWQMTKTASQAAADKYRQEQEEILNKLVAWTAEKTAGLRINKRVLWPTPPEGVPAGNYDSVVVPSTGRTYRVFIGDRIAEITRTS